MLFGEAVIFVPTFAHLIKPMRYQLRTDPSIRFADLPEAVEAGGKFIVFPYCISLFFAVTLRRFSPAIFVPQGQSIRAYQKRYDRISLLFGLWGIPWGVMHTFSSIGINRKGGLDVTRDIMLNLDETSFAQGVVELERTEDIFSKPDKWDLKAFERSLAPFCREESNICRAIAGWYINTEDPYYMIGLECAEGLPYSYAEALKKALYQQFRRNVVFEFADLAEDSELMRLLKEQGTTVFTR